MSIVIYSIYYNHLFWPLKVLLIDEPEFCLEVTIFYTDILFTLMLNQIVSAPHQSILEWSIGPSGEPDTQRGECGVPKLTKMDKFCS